MNQIDSMLVDHAGSALKVLRFEDFLRCEGLKVVRCSELWLLWLLFFSCYSCWLFFSCFSCWLCHCYVSLLAFLFLLGQVRSGSVRLRERYVGSASCRRCGACPTGWERQLERPPVDHLWSGLCSECFSECYITDECSE